MLYGAFKDYLDHIAVDKARAAGTVALYERWLRAYQAFCEGLGRLPQEIERHELRRFLQLMRARGYSADYVSHAIGVCKGFHDWLILTKLAEHNPWSLVERPPRPRNRARKVPAFDEVFRILTAFKDGSPHSLRDRAILAVLYGAGCRPVEACNLSLQHLDLDDGQAVVWGKGRGLPKRTVYFPAFTVSAIRVYLRWGRSYFVERESPRNVFLLPRGGAMNRQTISQVMREACKKAGIKRPLRPYDLRHAYATHMLQRGIDLESLRELMGHRSLATTSVYLHLDDSHIAAQHQKFHPLQGRAGERLAR